MKTVNIFLFCLVVFYCNLIGQSSNNAQKPNILVIHVDDLGYHDLSITGSKVYNTPAIDQLAGNSITFTNAYTNYPRCVPSRYAFLTGTYPAKENKGKLGTMAPDQNFVYLLNDAGYRTAYIGKYHLGTDENSATGIGFDYSFGAGETGGVHSRFYPFNKDKVVTGDKAPVPDVREVGKEGDCITDLLTNATIDFIEDKGSTQPFFAMLAFYAVHTPIEAKPEDVARNKKEIDAMDFGDIPEYIQEGSGRRKMRQDVPEYAAMVENVDENVARLMQSLKEMGVLDNTIVVFSSDHGGLSNDGTKGRKLATSNNPLRAGKGWVYEGGIRVPLFISWPGTIQPREENESIIQGMDVLTTVLDLATGQPIKGINGKSFKEVIEGEATWSDRTVFFHSSKARPYSTGDARMSAVRSGKWKLVEYLDDNSLELYDLSNDIGESNNVAEAHPEKVREMKDDLDTWKDDFEVKEYGKKKNKTKNAKK